MSCLGTINRLLSMWCTVKVHLCNDLLLVDLLRTAQRHQAPEYIHVEEYMHNCSLHCP